MKRNNWARNELILAINLYCKTPFGSIHQHNPDVINLARLIGRSPGAVAWKMCNFASIDPSLDRKGASNVSKLDIQIWNEFFNSWEQLIFESEVLLHSIDNNLKTIPEGKEKEKVIRARVNQNFFRQSVLASYGYKCCITGININELLVSSHIIPWAQDAKNRLNPCNGLCLNALHDKAFDRGLLTITDDFRVQLSPRIKKGNVNESIQNFFFEYDGKTISLPSRFLPDRNFLEYHRGEIFIS